MVAALDLGFDLLLVGEKALVQKNAADKLVREFQRAGAVGAQNFARRGHDHERDKKAAVNFGDGIIHIRARFPDDKIGFFLILFGHKHFLPAGSSPFFLCSHT